MANIWEIKCTGTGPVGTPPYQNVFHMLVVTPTGATAPIVTAFLNFYTSFKAYYPASVQWTACTSIVDITTTPGVIVPATPQSVAGNTAGSCGAAQVAQVVTWRTAHVGRSYRGRSYLGPFLYTAQSDGIWGSGQTNAVQAGASSLIAALDGTTIGSLAVYSRKLHTAEVVTTALARSQCYTQRHRGA